MTRLRRIGSLCLSLGVALGACAPNRACELTSKPLYVITPDSTAPGTIEGQIVALPDSTPLYRAQVLVNSRQAFAATDSLGHFKLIGTEPGTVTVKIQMISYQPVEFRVTLPASNGIRLSVGMVPSCVRINAVAN